MNNYLTLIGGYLLIFLSLVLLYFRLKKVEIYEKDLVYFKKLEEKFNYLKGTILRIINVSEKEIIYLWKNFIEKVLRRIKVSALKIETWANKKLEQMREKEI